MRNSKFLSAIVVLIIGLNCNPVKQLNQATSPIIPVKGCAGGFALRAKDAKIIKNDSLALGVIVDLSGAAKADLKATDSLLSTGAKVNIKANLASSFKKYFIIDQSIPDDLWSQSSAFTQLYCMLDKISSDPNVSQAIRDSANTRKISLITTQADYVRNVQKKKPKLIFEKVEDSVAYFSVTNYIDEPQDLVILSIDVNCVCRLPHVGLGGWVHETNRIVLDSVSISTSVPSKSYSLKNDSLIFHIPSRKSESFSFKYTIIRPKRNAGGCAASLEIKYIDPITGDKNTFQHILFKDANADAVVDDLL